MNLTYNDMYDDETIALPDIGQPITSENIDAVTKPTANTNGSSGFNVNDALKNVLNLLDGGFAVYQSVNNKIGQVKQVKAQSDVKAQPQVVVSAANPSVVFGLTTTQLLLIAGGLAAVLILPRLLRK